MAKRRRSRSRGAGTIGGAPILVLIVIGLIIKFWWVLLIALGLVAMTVALVRFANAPARPARLPTPHPQTAVTPPRQIPGSDDLAAQMRANKQGRRVREMQEWDYDWIRLNHPGKSLREVDQIANTHFARGRSIGINYEDPPAP